MGRPRKGSNGSTKSIYLNKDAEDIITRNGYQSNLSQFINNLILSLNEDSPEFLRIKLMSLAKTKARVQHELADIETEMDVTQGKLNLYKDKGDLQGKARQKVLSQYWEIVSKDRVKGDVLFRGWLTGPANLHYVKECGFASEEGLIAWCKSQEGKA